MKKQMPDLSHLSDIELVIMQYECRQVPEDKWFVDGIMKELGRRAKEKAKEEGGK